MSDRVLLPNQTSPPRPNWRTPPELFALLNDEFSFTLDAAADETNHLCPRWLGPGSPSGQEDALDWNRSWGRNETIWVNPPYSRENNRAWAARIAAEGVNNMVVALLNVATSNRWWFEYVAQRAAEIRFLVGRVPFIDPDTGRPISGNRYDSAVIVYSPAQQRQEVFWWDWRRAIRTERSHADFSHEQVIGGRGA